MTANEMLKANPGSIIIALSNPYKKTVRFMREDDLGQHPCESPSDFRTIPEWSNVSTYEVADCDPESEATS